MLGLPQRARRRIRRAGRGVRATPVTAVGGVHAQEEPMTRRFEGGLSATGEIRREQSQVDAVSRAGGDGGSQGGGSLGAEGVAAVSTLERPLAQADRTTPSAPARGGLRVALAFAKTRGGKAAAKIRSVPVRSAAPTGRSVLLAASVLRCAVTDALTLPLPFGELVMQAWSVLKVTALPAIPMAIPFGGMVAVQISGLVDRFPHLRDQSRRRSLDGTSQRSIQVG
jgi:hypothetical protein